MAEVLARLDVEVGLRMKLREQVAWRYWPASSRPEPFQPPAHAMLNLLFFDLLLRLRHAFGHF